MRHHRGPYATDPDYVKTLYIWAGCHQKKNSKYPRFWSKTQLSNLLFSSCQKKGNIYITQLGFGRGVSKRGVSSKKDSCKDKHAFIWLVVSTRFKNMSQNGFIFPKDRGETKKYLKPPHTMGTHNHSLLGVINPYLGA